MLACSSALQVQQIHVLELFGGGARLSNIIRLLCACHRCNILPLSAVSLQHVHELLGGGGYLLYIPSPPPPHLFGIL
jgi:hypothetical protein